MIGKYEVKTVKGSTLKNPRITKIIFDDTRFAVIWLVVRVVVGYTWVTAALDKLSSPAWMENGAALKGFWQAAVLIPAPPARPLIAVDWYRSFLQGLIDSGSYVWFAKLIAIGEFMVAVALILGVFVGVAAFFSGIMSWNYIMAGSASVNGTMLLAAIALILAWKIAGYWGLDRFVLRYVGAWWSHHEAPDPHREQSPTPA